MKCILSTVGFLLGATLFAGDLASFMNLGFSKDYRYFLFAEYGVNEEQEAPYASVYLLNVKDNTLNPKNSVQRSYDMTPLGTDAALLSLIQTLGEEQTKNLIENYEIDHLRQGRTIYFKLNSLRSSHSLSVIDYQNDNTFNVELKAKEAVENLFQGFNLEIIVRSPSRRILANKTLSYTAEFPVQDYLIDKIIVTEQNVLFIIEEKLQESRGYNLRYVLQTMDLSQENN